MGTYQLVNPHVLGTMRTQFKASTPLAAASKAWAEMSQYFSNNMPSFNFTMQEVKGSKGQVGGGSRSSYHHFRVTEKRHGDSASYKLTETKVAKVPMAVFQASLQKLVKQYGGNAVEQAADGEVPGGNAANVTGDANVTPASDDSNVTPASDDQNVTPASNDDSDDEGQTGGGHDSSSSSDDKPRRKHELKDDDSSDWLDDSSDKYYKKRRHFVAANTPISYFVYDPLIYTSDVFIPTFVAPLTPYLQVTVPYDSSRYSVVPKYHNYFTYWGVA